MKDIHGRRYLVPADCKKGLSIVCDGGFDCVRPWTYHKLKIDERGEFYFKCDSGQHFIEGQIEIDGGLSKLFYVGLYKAAGFKQRKDDHD